MTDKRLPAIWTWGVRDEDKTNLEAIIRGSTVTMDRLRAILRTMLDGVDRLEMSDEFLEKPNLDQRLFVNIGRRKELQDLLRLVTF